MTHHSTPAVHASDAPTSVAGANDSIPPLPPSATEHDCEKLSGTDCYAAYSKLFSLTNARREAEDAGKLMWNRQLGQLAWKHARTMYKRGVTYVPEVSSNAISVDVRGVDVQDVGESVFEQQLKAVGHEREMLNPYKRFCGVGVYGDSCRVYVVQIFS